MRLSLSRRSILVVEAIHELLAAGCCFPRSWPEAEIHCPPWRATAALIQRRHNRVEIKLAFTEGTVSAGLVVVQGAIRIDQVDVANLAFQHLDHLKHSAFEPLRLTLV